MLQINALVIIYRTHFKNYLNYSDIITIDDDDSDDDFQNQATPSNLRICTASDYEDINTEFEHLLIIGSLFLKQTL